MSWRTCYSGSNNIHNKSPALMSDTRQFTNWSSNCSINKYKLRDSDLMNCTELQCYYLDRQSAIISYLRDMLDKDGLDENL